MLPRRRITIALVILVAGVLLVGREAGPWLRRDGGQAGSRVAASFGPQLFLLSPRPDQASLLRSLPVTLHAELPGDGVGRYIASGTAAARGRVEAAGIAVALLDPNTAGKVYYFADGAPRDLGQYRAAVIYSDAQLALVSVPAENEKALVDALAEQRLHLALLPAEPISLAAEQVAAPALQIPSGSDPFVAALLPSVTEAALFELDAELSGERPVTIDGSAVTISSRYTFSPRIRDAERYLYQYYSRLGLDVYYFDWSYGSYSGRDVIAELPGSVNPQRVWLIGGHFDSRSENDFTSRELAPGGDDNASGTAATMLIAAILRNHRFQDTIRFVHFSGEEQGQWGSRPYAQSLRNAGVQMMGYIDLDMIGWDGDGDRVIELHTGTGPLSNNLGDAFISANSRYGQGLTVEKKQGSASRFSDHSPFWDAAYPAFLAIENFFADPGRAADKNPWYHTTGDQLERVDLDYLVRYTRTALAAIAEMAGMITNPTPTPTPTATWVVADTFYLPSIIRDVTPVPGGDCGNLLVNGDFEGEGGWTFGSSAFPGAYVTSPVFGGGRAVRLGVPPAEENRASYSSVLQPVTLPASAERILLRYWQLPGGGEPGDYRETLLLRNGSDPAILERDRSPGSERWVQKEFDLTGHRGSAVVLYFNVFNDGAGERTWNYLDDVALLACDGAPAPTATKAAPPSPPATPTETPALSAAPSPVLLSAHPAAAVARPVAPPSAAETPPALGGAPE